MAKIIGALAELVVVGVLLVVLLAFPVTYGWLAANRSVTERGMAVSAKDRLVEICLTPTGENIGVTAPSGEMAHLSVTLDETKGAPTDRENTIRPGSSGSVRFYIRRSGKTEFSFSYRISAVNDPYAENSGFFAGVTDEDRKADALRYIGSHLMFFTQKSADGVYSGRIAPGEAVRVDATAEMTAQGACPVTVYWVWVPWYSDLFSAGGALIAEEEREAAAAYYADAAHAGEMFSGGAAGEQGFNEADYVIGTTLKYVCFDLTVQGE